MPMQPSSCWDSKKWCVTYTRRPVAPVCHTALVTPFSTEQVERRWQCVQVFDMEKHLEYCGRFQQDPVQNQEYAAAKRSSLGPASRALTPAALYHVPHAARSSLLTHSCARPSHCCTTHCRASHAPSSGPVKPPARYVSIRSTLVYPLLGRSPMPT